ncbi:MAG TPA: AAA family ATPase [Chitinophagaceae bacterium]|jgi:NadR type nicotinamide-nucleotide adenylyltransferase|nr:AAA family ATPase [Chitinophagaceae bacterium]
MAEIKRIAIIGPESTGKSDLCRKLADRFHGTCCPEFAREYLTKYGKDYSFDDLLSIAKAQLKMEDDLQEKANGYYFIDTEMNVLKVWCEVVFGNCHTWILKQIAERKYDFYLLCDVDLPWVSDELREYPDFTFRKKLFAMYKDIVVNGNTPWAVVSGADEARAEAAATILDSVFEKRNLFFQ